MARAATASITSSSSRWGNGPRCPSRQAALATALLIARVARLDRRARGSETFQSGFTYQPQSLHRGIMKYLTRRLSYLFRLYRSITYRNALWIFRAAKLVGTLS
jgi:hypothetical protein